MNRWLRYVLVLIAIGLAVWLVRVKFLAADPVVVRTVRLERGTLEETVTNSNEAAGRGVHATPDPGARLSREGRVVSK
ncbi:MAG: hypothetical protein NTY35_03200 [Planctomycetota bacterium]|nr:hypothetical protein [Planctomycetota bacterium]